MLRIDDLHASVDGAEILKGLSLAVPAGEVHAIMGPNGAGKSTLSYVLTGRDGYEASAGGATLDLESPVAGRLVSHVVDEDEVVAPGTVIAEFEAMP